MKSCSEMRHLEQFGIKPLTGEADALGFRILCDLDEQGVKVFKECFGMPYIKSTEPYGMADNWNSGSIASVMLTGHDLVPLAIMGFYLQGYGVVVTDHAVYALEEMDDIVLNDAGDGYDYVRYGDKGVKIDWAWEPVRRIIRQKTSDGRVVQGTRNVHQMTGRVG